MYIVLCFALFIVFFLLSISLLIFDIKNYFERRSIINKQNNFEQNNFKSGDGKRKNWEKKSVSNRVIHLMMHTNLEAIVTVADEV